MSRSYCLGQPGGATSARASLQAAAGGGAGRCAGPPGRGSLLASLLGLALLTGGCVNRAGGGDPDAGGPPDLTSAPQPDLTPPTPWRDFPSQPIIDTSGTPDNAPMLFNTDDNDGGGPCMSEPESGAIMPSNWIRPRFSFNPVAGSGQNLFEVRIHAGSEANDLLVYTTSTTWTLPEAMWKRLSSHVFDEDITVTVRGGVWDEVNDRLVGKPAAGSTTRFRIAPAAVNGSIFYWSSGRTTAAFRANVAGEEQERTVATGTGGTAQCRGCHAPTPDGQFLAFVESGDVAAGNLAGQVSFQAIDGRPALPTWLTAAGQAMLGRPGQSSVSFSPYHYLNGDHQMLSVMEVDGSSEIIWTNLESSTIDRGLGWDVLPRAPDDKRQAAQPFFNHRGDAVYYVSASSVQGGLNFDDGDLMRVPWASGHGGEPTGVPGAHESEFNEFAPALSDDDQMLVFTRVSRFQPSFGNIKSQMWAVPVNGNTEPRLLAANAPIATCGSQVQQYQGNSGPRWAPSSTSVDLGNGQQERYYWLTFASRRADDVTPQIYIAAVVVNASKSPLEIKRMGAAVYLWNQPSDQDNHAPVWDAAIPPP